MRSIRLLRDQLNNARAVENPRAGDDVPDGEHAGKLRDPRRLAALANTGLLDSADEEAFDRFVRLASDALGVEVSLVSLVDDRRQFFKAQKGLSEPAATDRETPLSHSFCQYVVTSEEPLRVSDARTDPLLKDNGAIRDMGVVAYLGVPIRSPAGPVLGSLCAISDQPRDWTDRDLSYLTDLSAVMESEIALREEAAAREVLVHELNHRITNLFTIVSGMIKLTAGSTATSAEMGEALSGRVLALSKAHDLIRPAITSEAVDAVDVPLPTLISTLIAPHVTRNSDHLTIDGPALSISAQSASHFALVLHEIATNAAKYGALSVAGGWVEITWQVRDDRELVLDWTETGGPAVSQPATKSGFGTKLIRVTVEHQFDGRFETEWRPTGVHHRVTVPLDVLVGAETLSAEAQA